MLPFYLWTEGSRLDFHGGFSTPQKTGRMKQPHPGRRSQTEGIGLLVETPVKYPGSAKPLPYW
jgi:hypothetical protein